MAKVAFFLVCIMLLALRSESFFASFSKREREENRMITASCKRAAVYCSKYLPELDKDDEVLIRRRTIQTSDEHDGKAQERNGASRTRFKLANEDTISN